MPTHDIALPAARRPVFPRRCVVCDAADPGHLATVSVLGASAAGAAETTLLAKVAAGGNARTRISVPACRPCARRLERRHLVKSFATYASGLGCAAIVAVSVFVWGSVWLGLALGLAALIAPVAWEMLDPPAFTITPRGDTVLYEFRSAACAREFAAANAAAAGA